MSQLNEKESPSKRYARLKPWLDLANVTIRALRGTGFYALEEWGLDASEVSEAEKFPRQGNVAVDRRHLWRESQQVEDPLLELYRTAQTLWPQVLQRQIKAIDAVRGFLVLASDAPDFPAADMREWFGIGQESPPKEEARQGWKLLQLGMAVSDVFRFCAKPKKFGTASFHAVGPETAVVLDRRGTRLMVDAFDPYGKFLKVVTSTEIDRIRFCPICRNFFFALRTKGIGGYDASSKACSKGCNEVRRMRIFREREARQIEEAWAMSQKGKDAIAIAMRFRITRKKARAYLARAKKEHGK